ncbi:right-handed parallel beta-helix repeat-containing protein, partial [bacterium]|nr:right-handed parallel beta-helix repeat-containing protein [bacterium]
MRNSFLRVLLLLVFATSAWADTHTVMPGESIQAAIDAADPSDEINVQAGVYYGTITVNKSVSVTGAGTATYDGAGDWTGGTLITRDPNVGGQATNQVVHVTAADVTLSALTVDGRYGFDQGTGQTSNYGIMVEGVPGVTLTGLHVLDSTNNGIELNNADDAALTDVLCERTAFAPGYYTSFQYGLRCVDSDNLDVDGFTAVNVWRGVVVFQGYNSGVLEDMSVTGNGDADGYGVGFYTSPEPGWWQPAFGDYEGDLTFTFAGSHLFTSVDYGVYVSDELLDKDITLNVDPAAVFDFLGVTANGGWRLGSGSVPGLDTVMSDMGLTHKTSGPPDLYDYAPTTVWVDDDYCDGCANDGHVWGYDAYDNIQDGVDAVSGSTVYVAAGNYVEAILIEDPVTLLGATAGVNKNGYSVPAGYDWDPAVETIITHPDPAGGYTAIVDIHDTDDVTFDGFVVGEIAAVGNLNTSLVRVYAHTREITNIQVINCVIGPNTNYAAQDGAQGRMGLYLVNHPYDDNGIVNSTIAHNKLFDCKGNGDNLFLWTSYYAYLAPGPADMTGTVIDDNEIYGSHRSGIETAGGFANLTISNNVIYGNSQLPGDDPDFLKYGHGIQLIRGSSDKVSDPLTAYGPVDLLIIGNEIYGNSKCGVYMGPKNESITFTDNVIHDNGWNGVMVDLVGNYWNPTFESPPYSEQYACYDCSEDISGSGNEIYDNGTSGNSIADFGVAVNR